MDIREKVEHEKTSIESGTFVLAGNYQCAACGHVIKMTKAGDLPNCPEDDGHHKMMAWRPVASEDDLDAGAPNSPNHAR